MSWATLTRILATAAYLLYGSLPSVALGLTDVSVEIKSFATGTVGDSPQTGLTVTWTRYSNTWNVYVPLRDSWQAFLFKENKSSVTALTNCLTRAVFAVCGQFDTLQTDIVGVWVVKIWAFLQTCLRKVICKCWVSLTGGTVCWNHRALETCWVTSYTGLVILDHSSGTWKQALSLVKYGKSWAWRAVCHNIRACFALRTARYACKSCRVRNCNISRTGWLAFTFVKVISWGSNATDTCRRGGTFITRLLAKLTVYGDGVSIGKGFWWASFETCCQVGGLSVAQVNEFRCRVAFGAVVFDAIAKKTGLDTFLACVSVYIVDKSIRALLVAKTVRA